MRKLCVLFSLFIFLPLLTLFCGCGEEKRSSYYIDCVYDDENGVLSAHMDFSFYNSTGAEQTVLRFNLYPNAYRKDAVYKCVSSVFSDKAYYAGKSYGDISIDGVSGALSYEVGGEDKNILYVTLSSPVPQGGGAEIGIDFTVTLAKINHRLGIGENAVSLADFFPVLCAYDGDFYECVYYSDGDPYFLETADYTVKITLPKDYVVASSGELVAEKRTVENNAFTYKISGARTFALALSKKYLVDETEIDGVSVRYYYSSDENHAETLNLITSALSYFGEKFGRYVYPTYSVALSSFCYGGMEYPALSIVSDGLSYSSTIYSIVHETAHQWWYAMVGNNECDYAWMDEGLAEYSAALFFDERPEYGFTKDAAVNTARSAFRRFFSSYSQIFGEADTTMNRNLKDFVSEYEYANIAYNKGMLLFDALYESVGEDKFFSALKTYYNKYLYSVAKPQDLINCFKGVGVDAEGLFSSFIGGDGVI